MKMDTRDYISLKVWYLSVSIVRPSLFSRAYFDRLQNIILRLFLDLIMIEKCFDVV